MLFPVLGLKTSHPSLQSAEARPATSAAELGTPPFVLLHSLCSIQAQAGFDVLPCFESILQRKENNKCQCILKRSTTFIIKGIELGIRQCII